MDPLINSKMILLNELSILEEYGFTPPKVLTDEDNLNDIQFHYNLLKNKYFLKYGNYNFNDNIDNYNIDNYSMCKKKNML